MTKTSFTIKIQRLKATANKVCWATVLGVLCKHKISDYPVKYQIFFCCQPNNETCHGEPIKSFHWIFQQLFLRGRYSLHPKHMVWNGSINWSCWSFNLPTSTNSFSPIFGRLRYQLDKTGISHINTEPSFDVWPALTGLMWTWVKVRFPAPACWEDFLRWRCSGSVSRGCFTVISFVMISAGCVCRYLRWEHIMMLLETMIINQSQHSIESDEAVLTNQRSVFVWFSDVWSVELWLWIRESWSNITSLSVILILNHNYIINWFKCFS